VRIVHDAVEFGLKLVGNIRMARELPEHVRNRDGGCISSSDPIGWKRRKCEYKNSTFNDRIGRWENRGEWKRQNLHVSHTLGDNIAIRHHVSGRRIGMVEQPVQHGSLILIVIVLGFDLARVHARAHLMDTFTDELRGVGSRE
jgi:hypothetical protein